MSEKAAEQAAAHQVLAAHAVELNGQQERKRMATEGGGGFGSWPKKGRFDVDHAVKGKLHTTVAQMLGRSAGQTDFLYEIQPTSTGFVASLTLPTLAEKIPDLAWKTFVGEASSARQRTRLQAAQQALDYLLSHPIAAHVDLTLARHSDPFAPKTGGRATFHSINEGGGKQPPGWSQMSQGEAWNATAYENRGGAWAGGNSKGGGKDSGKGNQYEAWGGGYEQPKLWETPKIWEMGTNDGPAASWSGGKGGGKGDGGWNNWWT